VRHHVLRRFTLLLVILWTSLASLQAEQLPLHVFTIADGLGSDRINCLIRDSRGFLWFCTDEGISRYDGYAFANYVVDETRHRRVYAMLEAADGVYWVGLQGALARFDPAGRSASRFTLIQPAGSPRSWSVNAIAADPAGGLWIGTTNWGLQHVDRVDNHWRLRPVDLGLPNAGSEPSTVRALRQASDGTLWIGAGSGLYRRWPTGHVEHYDRAGLPGIDIRAIHEEGDGRLWIGARDGGLCEIVAARSPATDVHVLKTYALHDGLPATHIQSILQTSDGTLWAAGFGGLTRLTSPDASGARRIDRSYTQREGLTAIGLEALAEDRDGNLWIGTGDAGVMKLVRNGFTTYTPRDGLASPWVSALFEDRSGAVCAVTPDHHAAHLANSDALINRFDGRAFTAARPHVPEGTRFGWGWHQISFQDRSGDWWVPTFQGVYRFANVDRIDRLASASPTSVITRRNGLPDNEAFRLFEDSQRRLWISTLADLRSRLTQWDRASGHFHTYGRADGLPEDAGTAFAEDHAGSLWIGFFEAGLARLRDGRFTVLSASDGLPRGSIRALHVDQAGRVWVATGSGGLGRIDDVSADRPSILAITTRQGLSSDDVWSIAEDQWGRLYVGTGRGLDRLDPESGEVRRFTSNDGLAPGVVQVSLRSRHGDLWFGTPQGLSRLRPEQDQPRSPPPALITGMRVAGVPVSVSDVGEIRMPRRSLRADQNHVEIDFVGLGFRSGEAIRYHYKLSGADDRWSPLGQKRSVTFVGLAPGSYDFVVEAVGADGRASLQPASMAFTIEPPLWQRRWVRTVGALMLVLAAYAAHRLRIAQLLAVERVRARIATDLHDDVGTSLSRMSILSEVLKRECTGLGPGATRVLTEIAESARGLIDGMSDMVWSVDPRRDDLNSLIARFRAFASDVLDASGIQWAFEVPPDADRIHVGSEHRRHLFLILKEATTNVVRHAGCTRAAIRLVKEGSTLRAEVWDNGCGIGGSPRGAPAPEMGHGLRNMRPRAQEMGGRLEVQSSGGETCVRLTVALR
jgi:ligand-binding sensor domain-containing protein/signal transduction histidine kinase